MVRRSDGILDGFWLPRSLRSLADNAEWVVQWALDGRPAEEGKGVAARWPKFTSAQWAVLLDGLRASRGPSVPDLIARWQKAMAAVPQLLTKQVDHLEAVAHYTGYPLSMLTAAFVQGELVRPDALVNMVGESPTWAVARAWQPMPGGLPGKLRFYPSRLIDRLSAVLHPRAPLFHPLPPISFAVGFAAGNIPGNGLLLTLLLHIANHTVLGVPDVTPPAVLIRASRQVPLFDPWVLTAIEEIDAELVQGIALLVWDYDDEPLQRMLLGQVDLVMATASDQTIASLEHQLEAVGRPARFLRHGHKVSFSAIGRAALNDAPSVPACLAAFDSTFWDQFGCLSARVHFVEHGGQYTPIEYAEALSEAMRRLAERLPRGPAPRRLLHQAYDAYKLLEPAGEVRVFTTYEDDCLVVFDERPWSQTQWRTTVNRCIGRVVVVRPVDDLVRALPYYLGQLPPANLQSLSVAVDAERILDLAEAVGRCGVTALRSLGRAAFPQLAYSWDGLLPLDLGNRRPPGYFATLETEDPLSELKPMLDRLGL